MPDGLLIHDLRDTAASQTADSARSPRRVHTAISNKPLDSHTSFTMRELVRIAGWPAFGR